MALGVEGAAMKITIQITVESDDGQLNVAQEVAHLDRGTLRPETLGLTLAEARSILAGIEQTVVEQQAAEFIANSGPVPISAMNVLAKVIIILFFARRLAS
jgi:hypothetical protein